MAIPPTKNGGYGPNVVPHAPELAQVDQKLATRALDSLAADSITGTISLRQDPNHAGVHPTITGGGLAVTAPGSAIVTINGGRLVLGDGDVPVYSSPRTRTVKVSALEACRSSPEIASSGNQLVVHQPSGGVYALGYSDFVIPLAKPHDGATLNAFYVYYFYDASPSVLGVVSNLLVGRYDPTVGFSSLTTLGSSTPGSLPYNAGAPGTIIGPALTNNVLDLQTYAYGIFVRHNSIPTGAKLIFTGYAIQYTAIADARFTQ